LQVLHFSDSHLGYTELDSISKNGINLREQDFYDAFKFVIDQALEIQPNLVIHSGDFFHRPSPSNRPMIIALEQLKRLSKANIPIAIIAGNHETPKTIYTSPILKAFQTIEGVFPIFEQQYDKLQFGNLTVHGLPHINDDVLMIKEMEKIAPDKGQFNIIMLHTSIGKSYIMEEFGEKLFPPERLALLNQFDYVALGHWHNFQKVDKLKTGWYCGSTERMSDTEANKEKGFCLLNFEKGKPIEPKFVPIPTRPWYRCDIKNCKDKTLDIIETGIKDHFSKTELEGALVSIYLHNIKSIQSIALSQRTITTFLDGPVHINVKRIFADQEFAKNTHIQEGKSTEVLLKEFISSNIEDSKKAISLNEKAKEYFQLFEEKSAKKR